MARYDYRCLDCENIKEVTHSVKDDPVVECDVCGSVNTKRLISATRTVFKGTGFAINDLALDRIGMPQHVRQINKDRLFRD